MARVMPPGVKPLALFKVVASSQRAWEKFAAGSLLDPGPLPLREREIVIARTTARCGCGYEWGIHAALFARKAGLTPNQMQDTAAPVPAPALWSGAEQTLLASVDALLDRKRLSDDEFAALRADFDEPQVLEIVQLVAFYHGVSLLCGALALVPEPGTPDLPSKGV
jgi:alkylhydroperoxidase family enzyme